MEAPDSGWGTFWFMIILFGSIWLHNKLCKKKSPAPTGEIKKNYPSPIISDGVEKGKKKLRDSRRHEKGGDR